MRNIFSNLPHTSKSSISILALLLLPTASFATVTPGDIVECSQGKAIGTVAAPFKSSANVSPSVVIQLQSGEQKVLPANSLKNIGNNVQMAKDIIPQGSTDADKDMAFEIRSMTMVLVMQSHIDNRLLSDVSELNYVVHDNQLYIQGSLDDLDGLERILQASAELCDYTIAPDITIRPKIAS